MLFIADKPDTGRENCIVLKVSQKSWKPLLHHINPHFPGSSSSWFPFRYCTNCFVSSLFILWPNHRIHWPLTKIVIGTSPIMSYGSLLYLLRQFPVVLCMKGSHIFLHILFSDVLNLLSFRLSVKFLFFVRLWSLSKPRKPSWFYNRHVQSQFCFSRYRFGPYVFH